MALILPWVKTLSLEQIISPKAKDTNKKKKYTFPLKFLSGSIISAYGDSVYTNAILKILELELVSE